MTRLSDNQTAKEVKSGSRNLARLNCATSVPVQCYPYNVSEVCEPREEESVLTGDLDCVISQFCSCIKGSVIAEFIFEIGPLLYPFSIEFRDLLLRDIHATFGIPIPNYNLVILSYTFVNDYYGLLRPPSLSDRTAAYLSSRCGT